MATKNEKRTNERDDSDRQRPVGCFREKGRINGNESYSVDNPDGIGPNRDRADSFERAEGNIGKIVGQLRELQQTHLAYVEAHEARLQQRLEQARRHHQQVLTKMQDMEAAIQELLAVSADEEHF